MTRHEVDLALSEFEYLKSVGGYRTYDVHTNPGDVFSISRGLMEQKVQHLAGPTLLERLDYGPAALRALDFVYQYLPSIVSNSVLERYAGASESLFHKYMGTSHIDVAIGLPALSHPEPLAVYAGFPERTKVWRLGTINPHTVAESEAEKSIDNQISNLGIVGLKFNSNIQHFYPEPSRNPPSIEALLNSVYRYVTERKLFVLFHAGISYVPKQSGSSFEKLHYGVLENFFPTDRPSSFLGDLTTPTIVAHMGHYNLPTIRWDLLDQIIHNHRNVYFDTSGVSSKLVFNFIKKYGYTRVLFGSDMLYFDQPYAVASTYNAIRAAVKPGELPEAIECIFSKNFSTAFA